MDRLLKFFFEIGTLRKIARAHRQNLLTDDLSDNIASHSYRVAIIAYFLALKEKANVEKVVTMALFHDIGETRSGDQTWTHKRYVHVYEDEILEDQLKGLTSQDKLYKLMLEYQERKTKEAKIAKDADILDQLLLLREYIAQGNQIAPRWLYSKGALKRLYSKTAKDIANKLYEIENPEFWAFSIATDKRR